MSSEEPSLTSDDDVCLCLHRHEGWAELSPLTCEDSFPSHCLLKPLRCAGFQQVNLVTRSQESHAGGHRPEVLRSMIRMSNLTAQKFSRSLGHPRAHLNRAKDLQFPVSVIKQLLL